MAPTFTVQTFEQWLGSRGTDRSSHRERFAFLARVHPRAGTPLFDTVANCQAAVRLKRPDGEIQSLVRGIVGIDGWKVCPAALSTVAKNSSDPVAALLAVDGYIALCRLEDPALFCRYSNLLGVFDSTVLPQVKERVLTLFEQLVRMSEAANMDVPRCSPYILNFVATHSRNPSARFSANLGLRFIQESIPFEPDFV